MPRKITMQQIADHIGVSKFAVSKALSGKHGVSPELREKIVQVAQQMGYNYQKKQSSNNDKENDVQSSNVMDKKFVAVLLPNVRFQIKESLYWGKILDGVVEGLQENGLGMIMITEHSLENFTKIINPQELLGLIGVGWTSTSLLTEVKRSNIPFILVDHEDPLIPTDTLFVNNFDCVRNLTNYLLGLGHRNIQFIGNIEFSRSFTDRWLGFRTAMEERKVPFNQVEALIHLQGKTNQETYEEILEILKPLSLGHGTMPTAFICANDSLAVRTLDVLKSMGLRIPQDCSVCGFDNNDDTMDLIPGLTTVNVTKEILGFRAVQTLLWRLRNSSSPTEKILLSGDIIIRDSTAAPSKKVIQA